MTRKPRKQQGAGGRRPKSTLREYVEAIAVAVLLALLIRTFVVQAFKIPSGSMLPTLQIGDHILVNKFEFGPRLEIPLTNASLGKLPGFSEPRRGDVVVFVYPRDHSKDFIKRIIGRPGDVVEVRNREVIVNGQITSDRHAHFVGPRGRMLRGHVGPIYLGRAGDVMTTDGETLLVNGKPEPLPDREVFREQYYPLLHNGNHGPVTIREGRYFMMGDNRDNSQDSRVWGTVKASAIKGRAFMIYWSWDGQDRWVRWERIGSWIR